MIIKHIFYYYVEGNSLRMRIKWNSSKNMISVALPFKIDPSKFDKQKQRCKNNSYHFGVSAAEIHNEMAKYEERANSIFNELDHIPDSKEFKKLFLCDEKDEKLIMFTTAYIDFVNNYSKEKDLQKSTLGNYSNVYHIINKIGITYINYLDKKGIDEIHDFMVDHDYNNSYIKTIFSCLKTMITWWNDKYNIDIVCDFNYRFKNAENDIIYLEWDELLKIYNYKFDSEKLSYARDLFCLCSFTSLRISDAIKLEKKDIHDDYISLVTKKTSKALKIELNDYSRSIINKYKEFEKPFSFFSHAYINNAIKEIGKICEINTPIKRISYSGNVRKEITAPKYKLLSSHCGRRTFVVHCIRLGIPIEIVMKWTGHKSYDTLKSYIDIIDEVKQNQMAKFSKK